LDYKVFAAKPRHNHFGVALVATEDIASNSDNSGLPGVQDICQIKRFKGAFAGTL